MKELRTFNDSELQNLKVALEKATGLIFPEDSTRFGELKFHIYSSAKLHEFHFQIFWGPHKIFSQKHLKESNKNDLLRSLQNSLKKSSQSIFNSVVQYCEDRLNDFLQIELQPLLTSHGLDPLQIDVKVCQSNKTNPGVSNGGWPVWCVLMSWNDEFGEFQEFAHKIFFDVKKQRFNISADEIISKFINYRNQLL